MTYKILFLSSPIPISKTPCLGAIFTVGLSCLIRRMDRASLKNYFGTGRFLVNEFKSFSQTLGSDDRH